MQIITTDKIAKSNGPYSQGYTHNGFFFTAGQIGVEPSDGELHVHTIEEQTDRACRNIGIIQHGELVENTSMKALLAKLKSETFILDLAPKSPLPKLDGYQYRLVDTATLEVEVLREQGINSVFTQLSEQGIQVLSMRNKANRLEELFVSLVNEKQGDRA